MYLSKVLFRWQALFTVLLVLLWPSLAANGEDRTAWMKEAKWGVMTHYLANWIAQVHNEQMSVERWNELVDNFNVEGLAEQIKSVGAGYHLLTIGKALGHH